jgi:hypothetical protein
MQTHPRPQPPPNPSHRRQVFWQVWLPLGLLVIVFLGLCTLAVISTSRDLPVASQWAALSTIIVIVPSCLGAIFSLLFLIIGIFLSSKAIQGLPGITYQVQVFFRKVAGITRYYSDRLASPVIQAEEKFAGFASLFKHHQKPTREERTGRNIHED